jgi:hypothetical protein
LEQACSRSDAAAKELLPAGGCGFMSQVCHGISYAAQCCSASMCVFCGILFPSCGCVASRALMLQAPDSPLHLLPQVLESVCTTLRVEMRWVAVTTVRRT